MFSNAVDAGSTLRIVPIQSVDAVCWCGYGCDYYGVESVQESGFVEELNEPYFFDLRNIYKRNVMEPMGFKYYGVGQ